MRLSGLVVIACAALVAAGVAGCGSKAPPAPESRILGNWEGNLSREIDNHRFKMEVEFKQTHQGILTLTHITDRASGRVYKSSNYANIPSRQVGAWGWQEEGTHDGAHDRRWVNDRHAVQFWAWAPDSRDLEPRKITFMGVVEPGGILWGTYQTNHNEDLGTWRMEKKS